jgi:hypothetical protein
MTDFSSSAAFGVTSTNPMRHWVAYVHPLGPSAWNPPPN